MFPLLLTIASIGHRGACRRGGEHDAVKLVESGLGFDATKLLHRAAVDRA